MPRCDRLFSNAINAFSIARYSISGEFRRSG